MAEAVRIKRKLMAEQWDQFARAALNGVPAIVKQEIRRYFYAGAQAILFGVIDVFAPKGEPTEEDLQIMQDVDDELLEFVKAVEEGRA